MRNKLLTTVFSVCVLIVALGAFNVFAATEGIYSYWVSDGEATISGCDTSATGEIVIPSTLGGCPVTSIGNGAFYSCSSLESIEIPEGVTSIGKYAFSDCTSLKTVYYGGTEEEWNNISIGTYNDPLLDAEIIFILYSGTCGDNLTWTLDENGLLTISGTGAMDNWTYSASAPWDSYRSSIKSVVIQDGVTSIGDYAFYYCESLASIEIPDSVTSIGEEAFYYCTGLTSVTIPDSVTSIGTSAFYKCTSLASVTFGENSQLTSIGNVAFECCTSLTSIEIPDSVTSIGSAAFHKCTSLASINVDADNKYYQSDENGVLFNKLKTTLIQYPVGRKSTEYIIPYGVTSIGEYAFRYCTGLASVTIGNSVTSIGNVAFENCTSLTSIEIPDSVTSIGEKAFRYCTSLASVTIGNSVTSIGEYAFYNCTSLASVTIGNSVTSIGYGAFEDCTSLASVTFGENSQLTSIDNVAFEYCTSLTSIEIPDSVTSIGEDAFYKCESLKTVYYGGTEAEWKKISIGSGNEPLTNATIQFVQPKEEEYTINSITIKDMSGNSLTEIPTDKFLATISFTNVSSSEDTVIILAQYTANGTFKGIMYIQTEDVPAGSTLKLSIPVDNTSGEIAKLKAFCWASFSSMTPMGNSASFPNK